jgi:hypothetical protein
LHIKTLLSVRALKLPCFVMTCLLLLKLPVP